MKKNALLLVSFLVLLLSSCNTAKDGATTDNLSNTAWELEYISGPRIAFEGLYPDKKPKITFNTATNEVSGNSGCNGYRTKYTLEGNTISFGEPGPTTMMFCNGGGEETFLKMMKKVNNYSIDKDGKLNLNFGEISMMRFKKSSTN